MAVRDWAAYSHAQAQEAHLFDLLLTDLVDQTPEPLQERGRPRVPQRTLAWCSIKKASLNVSLRRGYGYIQDAEQAGFIDRAPRYNAVSDWQLQPESARILRFLVRASAKPFRNLERMYAVDSTGFATATHGSYMQTRYGKSNRRRIWVKLHAMTGIQSNVITDALVMEGNSPDSPQLPRLLAGTEEAGFRIVAVAADKAYSGRPNLTAINEAGAEPLIPFKANAVMNSARRPPGHKYWKRAYHYFSTCPDEFLARYHQRSNVESTFSAIKRRYGERLASRCFEAQRCEVLAKAIAWNIACTIRGIHCLGVEPAFEP